MTNDPTAGGETPPERARPWLPRAVLIGSLALNLFLGGLVIGGLASGGPPGPPPGGFDALMSLREAAGQLPGDGGTILRETFQERRADMRAAIAELGQARRDTRAAVLTDPFDPEAAAAALADLRNTTNAVQSVIHEALVAGLGRLSPEQREILVERLGRGPAGLRGGGGPGEGRGPHRPPDSSE